MEVAGPLGTPLGLAQRSLSELRELVMDREAWRAAIHRVAKSWMRVGLWRKLSTEELMLLHCGVGEDS